MVLQKQQLLASKESAKARISQASASIQAQQVQLKVAGQDLERIKNMLAGGAATQKQMDEIQGRFDVLSSQMTSMQAQKQAVIAEA